MKGQLPDKIRIQHILGAIAEIEVYLTAVEFENFVNNSEKRFATVKQIEIIGEACNHISQDIKQKHPEIPWVQINGFRNISIHEYFGVNVHIVWDIATSDLPFLKEEFENLLKENK